ncbi:MAG: N-carbamoylputrescine amidase [Opitutales bacterium]
MAEPRQLTVAALQAGFSEDIDANLKQIEALVREAAGRGAQVILPPELFENLYFCQREEARFFDLARPVDRHPAVLRMQGLAQELAVAIPCSFFERDGTHHYNSLAWIGPDGAVAGVYRKSHIPDGPGYEEKFYFRPGNTGFRTWPTPFAGGTRVGVGICWDQWFPECARSLVLLGAEVLCYPTAIGSEPEEPDFDTARLWRRAMIGHAVSNVVPVVAANRVGDEHGQVFYGTSFIADHRGDILAELDRAETGILTATLDTQTIRRDRAAFGFFRDRRPELYGPISESR